MDNRSSELQAEYNQRFDGSDTYRDAVWKILCTDFFSRLIPASSTVLDLGAGWGEFSRNIPAQTKYAMDLNPDCGRRVSGYATFINQDCSMNWPFDDGHLDIIFTSNFLEHLPSKEHIDNTLKEAIRCLKPGGKIICLGPNIKFLPGSYWDYWDHFTPITDSSIAEALSLRGFNVTDKIDRFLPYTMSNTKKHPLIAVSIYLRLPIFWPIFGKQFLVVAVK